MSKNLFKLLSKYTSDIEIVSIDECFLDYTKIKNLYGDQLEFAKKVKNEIYNTFGFTVNIGIANNKLCAKMASDFSKPNKIHTLYEYEVKEKITNGEEHVIRLKSPGDSKKEIEFKHKYYRRFGKSK